MFGKIIFLNGTSSAGKTTLAHALQERLPEPWLHIALDQFRDGMPSRFRGLNSPAGTNGEHGLNVVPVTRNGRTFTEVRFGEMGRQMLRGMRRAILAMVQEGNNVIIDDILLDPEFLGDYLQVLSGMQVYFVGVKCSHAIISERERARPGRFPGTAIGHYELCHSHKTYDVEVHTDEMLPAECANYVAEYMRHHQATAFAILRARRTATNMAQQQ